MDPLPPPVLRQVSGCPAAVADAMARAMAAFRVVLMEHGYASTEHERSIIESAGGELICAEHLPVAEAIELCQDADGVMLRRFEMTGEVIARLRRCKVICRYG